MDELSSDVLVGNKPSTLQISRVVAHGASLGYLVALWNLETYNSGA